MYHRDYISGSTSTLDIRYVRIRHMPIDILGDAGCGIPASRIIFPHLGDVD